MPRTTKILHLSRLGSRLLVGALIAGGVTLGTALPASAATTAGFSAGVLTVTGDNADNNVTVSRNAAGGILVNGEITMRNAASPPSSGRQHFYWPLVSPVG